MRLCLTLAAVAALVACNKPSTPTPVDPGHLVGNGSSTSSNGGAPAGFDAGLVSNACGRDQDCAAGKVCGGPVLGCVPGAACNNPAVCGECEAGGSLHCGFEATAYCDTAAGVCRRTLSSCEPCTVDAQCGENLVLGVSNRCLEYAGGGHFCGLACASNSCSPGFECSSLAGTPPCPAGALDCACRAAASVGSCAGAVPCRVEGDCPQGKHCTTAGSTPPRVGVCLGFCLEDAQCPQGKICQTQPGPALGQCIQGCTPGQAGANQSVCHAWGRAGPPCPATACPTGYECSNAAGGYCRLPGCQTDAQCPLVRTICDTTSSTCVEGCHVDGDCGAFEHCSAGTCVDQGCRGKNLSCNLGQFCCGKELYDVSAAGGQACPAAVQPGACFLMPDPFCRPCQDEASCANITAFGVASHCYQLQQETADGGAASMGKYCSVGCRSSDDCPRGMVCHDLPAGQNGETIKGCLDALCTSIHPSP